MGSLLPGWDERAPGVAPRGFEDYSDHEEELGYFAAYSKMKKEQKEAGELSRTSMPLSRRNSMPVSLGRRSMPAAKDDGPLSPTSHSFSHSLRDTSGFGSFKAPPKLQRLASMPVTAGERFELPSPKGLQSPRSPGSGQLSSSPFSPSLQAYKTKHAEREVQWWRNFDSAALNEMPDVPHEKDRAYTPQYKVAGQALHYRGLAEGDEAAAAAAGDGHHDDVTGGEALRG